MTNKRTISFILAILLGSIIVQAPLYNRHLAFNDEGYILNTAEQLSRGDVLYRDKPGYVFPGLFYFLALLYKIFGVSFVLSRVAMAVVFSAMCVLVFLICRRMTAEWVAFCTALTFLLHKAWAFPIWNIIGYTTFSIFFLSLSAFFLLKHNAGPRPLFVFLCGVFGALGGIFRQDYAAFVCTGFFLFLIISPRLHGGSADRAERDAPSLWKAPALYTLGGALVILPVLAYFTFAGALPDMFLNTFWAPLTAETKRETTRLISLFPLFSQDQFLRTNLFEYVPSFFFDSLMRGGHASFLYRRTFVVDLLTKLVHYSPYAALLATAGVLGARYRGGAFGVAERNAGVIFVYSASLILTQHRPYNLSHLMQMYAPTLILLGFLVDATYRWLAAWKIPRVIFSVLLAIAMLLYAGETVWATRFMTGVYSAKLEGPRANIYLTPEEERVWSAAVGYVREATSPDEPIFVIPYHSIFYFFSDRRNATRFDILWGVKTYATRDEEIIDVLDRRRVRYVVYSPTQPQDWGLIEEFAPELMRQIRLRYSVDKTFGHPKFGLSFIVMKRKED